MTLLQLNTSKIAPIPFVRIKRPLYVYTAEFNVVMGAFRYLPFSTGLLRAFAMTDPVIRDNVHFMPFLYEMDTVKGVWSKITEAPDIFAFSLSMWNEQLSLTVAKSIKEVYRDKVLIVFGGCHVPHHPTEYMQKYPFIDVCVRSEGEEAFRDILLRCIEGASFDGIADLTYRIGDYIQENLEHRSYQKDMDCYPSPYMTGLFDDLMENRKEGSRMFQTIIESNRGCPFDCSFCVSADSMITTLHGDKRIDEINVGDYVLGWDSIKKRGVWNRVELSLYMGKCPTMKIMTKGGFNVRTTSDHQVYTQRGWIEASKLHVGDKVLSYLRSTRRSSSPPKKILFQEMWVYNCLSGHDQKQPHEEKRGCRETSGDSEKIAKRRESYSLYVYSRRPESYERDSQEKTVGPRQPNETCRNTSEDGGDSKGEAFQNIVGAHEKEQSHEQPRNKGEVCELVEGPGYYEEIPGSNGRGIECPTEQVREESQLVFGREQSSIQICRGLIFLAGAVSVRNVPKSRLYSHYQGNKEDYSCSWQEMAWQSEGSAKRDQRLRRQGVEVFYHLGRRHIRYEDGEKDLKVCWEEIVSIEKSEEEDVYDLVNLDPHPNFFANGMLVHNCYWAAGGLMTKYRFHSLEYTKDEITWAGKNHIPYLFMADSNFAMHPRDREIAEHTVKTKRDYGSPEKLRVCWGKNTDEKVYQVAGILHQAELEKGITLARQSNDPTTLKNIRRDNIKLSAYQNLQKRFTDINVPTYTELILGLPGETVESWKSGIDEILTSSGLKANLFVYLAQVLPNTELWRQDYRRKHGIKTRLVELTEIHGSKRNEDWITEYEELVIATNSMPYRDWRHCCKFSWMTMLLHSMKSGFFIMGWLWNRFKIPPSEFIEEVINHNIIGGSRGVITNELQRWEDLLDRISVFGESRGQILEDYGNIYWDVEEAALLRMSERWGFFYEDLKKIVCRILNENKEKTGGEEYLRYELNSVFAFQELIMPHINKSIHSHTFLFNTPEYFDCLFGTSPILHEEGKSQKITLQLKDWENNKERFAKETILWGRKSGTMIIPYEWKGA